MKWTIFPCTYWPFVYFLWRNIYSGPLLIFESGILLLSCRSSLYILDMNLSDTWSVNFFHHLWATSSLCWLCRFISEILHLDVVQTIFAFVACAFGVIRAWDFNEENEPSLRPLPLLRETSCQEGTQTVHRCLLQLKREAYVLTTGPPNHFSL